MRRAAFLFAGKILAIRNEMEPGVQLVVFDKEHKEIWGREA